MGKSGAVQRFGDGEFGEVFVPRLVDGVLCGREELRVHDPDPEAGAEGEF